MAYSFEIFRANGAVLVDGGSLSAMLKDVISVPAGAAGSAAYPDLVGRTISVTNVSSTLVFDYRDGNGSIAALRATSAVTYPGGVPTVSWWFAQTLPTDVYVDTTLFIFSR